MKTENLFEFHELEDAHPYREPSFWFLVAGQILFSAVFVVTVCATGVALGWYLSEVKFP